MDIMHYFPINILFICLNLFVLVRVADLERLRSVISGNPCLGVLTEKDSIRPRYIFCVGASALKECNNQDEYCCNDVSVVNNDTTVQRCTVLFSVSELEFCDTGNEMLNKITFL